MRESPGPGAHVAGDVNCDVVRVPGPTLKLKIFPLLRPANDRMDAECVCVLGGGGRRRVRLLLIGISTTGQMEA